MVTATRERAKTEKENGTGAEGVASRAGPHEIVIPKMDIQRLKMTIVGDTSLICKCFSKKEQEKIEKGQGGEAKPGRKKIVKEDECEQALYRMPDGKPGFPGVNLKCAAVDAAIRGGGMHKTDARAGFFVVEDMIPIKGTWKLRTDPVRIGKGQTSTASIRHRPEFKKWELTFTVRFNAGQISESEIVNLFNIAGFSGGIGDWRPQKSASGQHGCFHVK